MWSSTGKARYQYPLRKWTDKTKKVKRDMYQLARQNLSLYLAFYLSLYLYRHYLKLNQYGAHQA